MIPDRTKIYNNKNPLLVALSLCLLLIVTGNSAAAQQQAFSYTQYMDNLTPFNPAYSLLDKAGSIHTLARRQWVGVEGAPVTYLINGNLPIEPIDGAAGLIVFNNQLAIEHQTEVNAYFAKGIQLDPYSYLAVSLNAGVRSYAANYSTLDSNDPTFRNDVRGTKPNIGFGVIYYTGWYYLGISAPELTITSLGTASIQNNSNFRSHYYFSGALLTNISEDIKFKPATLVAYARGVPLVANVSGTMYMKQALGIGINYSTDKAMAGIVTINMNAFHVGYSYQFGTSSGNLGGFNNATHEISISYRFGNGAASNPNLL
ncbi:PorP/SprF family type IX secretion system membrane protein [Mucilaginibacter ginsenosidivorax]|uniref:Type IX secretion system membrane protein PorP/SprF n=1 Tax=Mucilaginibacter ginsenosidivorax TaxID=862126 RepID=A0A5B8W7R1_9SPHI|nr:PorP/SprF family type IX secretion system membrane protein [Mucilaginibacter ginsenosidivorax]QEC79517.1 type IX secretion system membrane protein PorP/SprF [Mucilaginibacter ginsenosidivorax]